MAGTITHQWNGTILTITSDSGTSAMDLKGAKGDDGARGAMGLPGDANLIEAVDKAEKAAADAETALSQLGTARDEAVAAAAQVKAIVAGNEAFTKAESDSRFANAIKPTATGEVATANDSGNYPLQGLSIYGKTTQAGTPTPTSPIDLVNIGSSGSIGVKVRGKNLVNAPDITFTAAGYAINSQTVAAAEGYYTLSFVANAVVACQASYKDRLPIIYTQANVRMTQTFYAKGGIDTFALYVNGAATITDIQLEAGTAATPFETYKDGGSITLNTPNGLPGIPVSSGGNYTDSTGQQWLADEIDLAKGVYIQRIKSVTFNGTEQWNLDGGKPMDTSVVFRADSWFKDRTSIEPSWISTAFIATRNTYGALYDGMFFINGYGHIIVATTKYNNINEWKAYLNENPMTVIYAIATPTETPLTAAEIAAFKALQSQYPNTTVYSDANAGIAATYVADTKTYIDNKFNELSTALIAMGG